MFQTRLGSRNLMHRYTAGELASTLTAPTLGQIVALKTPPAPVLTQRKKRAAKRGDEGIINPTDPDLGKLQAASAAAAPTGSGEVDGVIVQVIRTAGGSLDSIVVAPPGEEVPLALFGPLSRLQAFGFSNMLYLSADTAGTVAGSPPIIGNYVRKVARVPKMMVYLTDADLDPNDPRAIYVQIIEERPLPT